LRRTDYPRLDAQGQAYLDYTGGGMYADSQIRAHTDLLLHHRARKPPLRQPQFLGIDDAGGERATRGAGLLPRLADYTAIFTLNASGALKHVGESFPFTSGGRLLLAFDNHNSVNGIREFARARGASFEYARSRFPICGSISRGCTCCSARRPSVPNLFAFPAQSNFSGVKHPLDLVDAAHAEGWRVLLDAAAFVPTNRLDLSSVKPDFVTVSFYKMFGYPTGVGCLLVRKTRCRSCSVRGSPAAR
jgi:selenocysteine lyase/cysteine desulfurase